MEVGARIFDDFCFRSEVFTDAVFFSILIFVSEHFSVNTCFMRAGVVET